VVTENAGEGTDTVLATAAAFTLGANVENLTFTGTGDFSGTGNAQANIITGGSGNDTLDGAGGADTLIGGLGDDTYGVDLAADVLVEAAGEGTDTVLTSVNPYVLGANLENLVFTGVGNASLRGNELANAITGGTGNDVLNGLAGADTMTGGIGNDSYHVDDALDVVNELPGQGIDTVNTTLAAYALGANLENLRSTGTGNFAGTGNGNNNTMLGAAGDDTLSGGAGSRGGDRAGVIDRADASIRAPVCQRALTRLGACA